MELNGGSDEVTLGAMLVTNPIHAGALTSRALVDEVGGFCEDLFGTEDYDLWLRIVERGHEIVVVPRAALRVPRSADVRVEQSASHGPLATGDLSTGSRARSAHVS